MLLIKKYIWYCIFFIVVISCITKGQFDTKELYGKWVLQEESFQINYPILYFNTDSTAIFTSHGDTIYRFRYKLLDNYLLLKDILNQETKWKVIELTKSQLVFENLFENEKEQFYKREPNDINNK